MHLFKKGRSPRDYKTLPIRSLRPCTPLDVWATPGNKFYTSKVKAEILFRLPIREVFQAMAWCGRDIRAKLEGTCHCNFWLNNDRRYDCYFPNIYKQSVDGFLSLCPRTGKWLTMPPLNFLPNKPQKVLAGAGGLLLLQGGIEVWRPQAPEFSNSSALPLWKPLDTLIVVNPLHAPLHAVLPPMLELLDYKTAYMEVKTVASAGYVVHVVGWDKKRDHIVVATFDRNSPSPCFWTHWCSQYVNLRPDTQDNTSLALSRNKLFLGGDRRDPATGAWVPVILVFNYTTTVWSSVEWDHQHYEPPRVMGTRGNVYVVTRTKYLQSDPKMLQKMVIYKMSLKSLQAKTRMPDILEVAEMPNKMYRALFRTQELGATSWHAESAPSEDARCLWQCRAGLGLICFHANKWHSGLVLYNTATRQWGMTNPLPHCSEEAALANCTWNPNFQPSQSNNSINDNDNKELKRGTSNLPPPV